MNNFQNVYAYDVTILCHVHIIQYNFEIYNVMKILWILKSMKILVFGFLNVKSMINFTQQSFYLQFYIFLHYLFS